MVKVNKFNPPHPLSPPSLVPPDGGEDLHGHGPGLGGGEGAVPEPGAPPGLRLLPQAPGQGRAPAGGLLPGRHISDLRPRGALHLPRQTQGTTMKL